MLKKIIRALASVCLLSACVTSPTGRSQLMMMPETQIDQMGLREFSTLKKQKQISRNPRYNQIAHCVAQAITNEVGGGNWEVVVFVDPSPNAFALPGNKIGVYSGMFKLIQNSSELAAVIGHEVGHVLAKHSNERASQQMAVQQGMGIVQQTGLGQSAATLALLGLGTQYGVLMPFSRTQESEADMIGVDLMAKAGFDPRQSVSLWQLMDQATKGRQPIEFMSTHPSDATRIQQLQQHMPQAMALFQQAQAMGKNPRCN